MNTRLYRLGVDVGGTNTDSVLIDITNANDVKTRGVVASFKHTTTPDVTTGIEIAVQRVLEKAGLSLEQRTRDIWSLTIGTTHFINAVVQSDATKLSKVAVIRLAAPYTEECPPFIDFPEHLKHIICGHTAILKGGLQVNGGLVNDIDEDELIREAIVIRQKGIKSIVIVGIYSPLDTTGQQEYRARAILLQELGKSVNIICSRDVAQIGILERENASILNASILPYARRTISSFKSAMKRLGVNCPLYLTQNDGALTSANEAARLPVRTFNSGATNSMRGAGYLAGLGLSVGEGEEGELKRENKSVVVVDIGGTTTDVGVVLPSGYPRLAGAFAKIAGVRTNFSMPDVYSMGLGGGSRVHSQDGGVIIVGPDSVGNRLEQDALVFGGSTITATDITVHAQGISDIGEPGRVASLAEDIVEGGRKGIYKLLSSAIDRMKTSPEDIDVLLVGGGSIICPTSLRGVNQIIIPPHHDVANAIGAAISNISGEINTILIPPSPNPSPSEMTQMVEGVKKEAIEKAVKRVRESEGYAGERTVEEVDYEMYRPKVLGDEWILSETDLQFVMEGCGVLGTGGGGSPYPTYLICLEALRKGKTICVVDHSSLPPDGLLARGAFMGSPSVGAERLRDPRHLLQGAKELAKYCGNIEFVATFSDEIGGSNGLQALALSGYLGLPAFDGDTMGRADRLLISYLAVYNRPNALVPCALSDGNGNIVIVPKVKNDAMVETIMRTVTTEMGSSAALCPAPLAVADARDYGITRCLSLAWWIGRAICICRQKNMISRVAEKILECQNGKCLFVGKIVKVSREVKAGFTWGYVRIAPLLDDEKEESVQASEEQRYEPGTTLRIPFQNEDLCAYLEKADGTRTIVASVPDLITVLDSQTGSHLGTPEYAYGLRVTVIVLAGHPLWKTEIGLNVGGPEAFGYLFSVFPPSTPPDTLTRIEHTFVPVAEYREPKSVVAEFRVR
ncbi:Hydantoin utilization protein A [Leucoagaricus sp. SymC.cos]|nr:Hydantoin utilization protein A [Leucoagaricus sp. SymC.cos]